PTPLAVPPNLIPQVLGWLLIIAAVHAWPFGLATLARGLRWPQLVRPLALTLIVFALRPVYLLTGLVAGALLSGGWPGLFYTSVFLLGTVNIMMVFGLFLGRAAWRADREFRRLVPAAARRAPPHRSLAGGSALVAAVTYAALLAGFVSWAGYLNAAQVRLPTAIIKFAREMVQGQALSKAGDLAGAKSAYRRALESSRASPGGPSLAPA